MAVKTAQEIATVNSIVWIDGPARRPLTLKTLVKSGGAGSIYLLRESHEYVAKIYHDQTHLNVYEKKVQAMLSLSPNLQNIQDLNNQYIQIAWPKAIIRDEKKRFIGYTMPLLDIKATSELECILQERQARAEGLPTGLGAKITLATNLCAVMAELHKQHHYVVDLKPVNLRFYRHSLYLAMLDCDGFSIQGDGERFEAPQYTPEYLAPEFHVAGITKRGEEQQDRFALAVIIFQLLNFGIHPFTGKPSSDRVPTDIPGRIRTRAYAYGIKSNALISPSMVSGHAAIATPLRHLFDRAFDGAGNTRPTPLEWVDALKPYAQKSAGNLVLCQKNNEHQHFHALSCGACQRDKVLKIAKQHAASPRVSPAKKTKNQKGRNKQRQQNKAVRRQAPYPSVPQAMSPASIYNMMALKNLVLIPLAIIAALIVLLLIVNSWDPLSDVESINNDVYIPETIELKSDGLTSPDANGVGQDGINYRDYVSAEGRVFYDKYPVLPLPDLSKTSLLIDIAGNAARKSDTKTLAETLENLKTNAKSDLDSAPRLFDSTTQYMEVMKYHLGNTTIPDGKKPFVVSELLRQILLREPRAWASAQHIAENNLQQKLPEYAANNYTQVIWVQPENIMAWYGLAMSKLALQKDEDAMAAMAVAEYLLLEDRYANFLKSRIDYLSYSIGFNQRKKFVAYQIRAKQLAEDMRKREAAQQASEN
jgi:eukaryotic-like serine/threonine-protein kinase